jgi:hypothetical protein
MCSHLQEFRMAVGCSVEIEALELVKIGRLKNAP